MSEWAVAVTGREQAELVPLEPPSELGRTQVRGHTLYTLISPGTELAWAYTGSQFPAYPGYSAVFRVEEIGPDVSTTAVGDLVFCMGRHQSIQQHEASHIVPLPAGLPPEDAVIARLMGVTMTTLMTTTARPGDRVMVMGAGPVGYLGAQNLALSAYEVIVVEPNDARREMVARSGVSATFTRAPLDDPALQGTIALALECSGHEGAALDACRMVRKRGEVVLVGTPWRQHTNLTAHELTHAIFHNYVVLRSGWEWEVPMDAGDFRPHSIFTGFRQALRWLQQGLVPLAGLTHQLDPRNVQAVYQDLLHQRGQGLYAILDWGQLH